jgi:hypothetical protein
MRGLVVVGAVSAAMVLAGAGYSFGASRSTTGVWAGVDDGPAAPSDPFAAIPGAHDDPPPF